MKNERHDMFNQIHKALRGLFYETALCLQQTDFGKNEEAEQASVKVEEVLEILSSHARHEDHFILPLVYRSNPAVARAFEDDHQTDERLTKDLEKALSRVQSAVTPRMAIKAGQELQHLFIEFIAFNLTHMNKEESILNEILWKHFSDEELQAVEEQLIASIPQEEMMFTTILMLKGMNNPEIINLLGEAREALPPQAFTDLLQLTENTIDSNRWAKLHRSITEAEVWI